MKALLTAVLTFISRIACAVSVIWIIVEFLIYLVKDKPFNWWSVWAMLISGFLTFAFFILTAVLAHKANKKEIERLAGLGRNENGIKKSSFQTKLEEMAQRRQSQIRSKQN